MNESIMKTDRRGRLRYTQEQKRTMVEAYQASGLSAPRFAKLHGVNYQTLVSWIKKGKRATSEKFSPPLHPALLSLVPAEIDDATTIASGRAVEVLLPSGTKIIISSPAHLDLAILLISKLEKTRPC
jgi:transposase-like protein